MMLSLHKNIKNLRRSKLVPVSKLLGFLIGSTLATSCIAAPGIHSAKNDFSDNPFMVIGVNPKTMIVTGYFSALLTAPGKTDECKFLFRGAFTSDGKIPVSIKDAVLENQNSSARQGKESAALKITKREISVDLPKSLAPGDCDWVLESVGGPNINIGERSFRLSVDAKPDSEFIGVVAIHSNRAFFYSKPDATAARKAFLVAGDVAYVTEEKPGWYYVKFTHAIKETVGWIKASDTIQF